MLNKFIVSITLATCVIMQNDMSHYEKIEKQIQEKRIAEVENNYETIDIEMTLVEINSNGYFFYDFNAKEGEEKIFVDYGTINHFKMNDIHIGDEVIGIFDKSGWELFGLKEIK